MVASEADGNGHLVCVLSTGPIASYFSGETAISVGFVSRLMGTISG